MIGVRRGAIDLVRGVVTCGMCVTGVYLWLKRRRPRVSARKARRKRAAAAREAKASA